MARFVEKAVFGSYALLGGSKSQRFERSLWWEGSFRDLRIPFYFSTITFALQLNSKEFLPSATFWTTRGHRCLPFFPPGHASINIAHIGFSIPTCQLSTLVHSNRFLLTHSVALSASQLLHKKKSVRARVSPINRDDSNPPH